MDKILSINLETSTAPIIQEVRGKDYIEYGTDEWKNLYPQFLIDLYYNSSTHAAIINATSEMIAGEDLICNEEDYNLDAFVKLKKFLRHANSNESLHQVIKKVSFDFKLQGAYAIHVIWNRERTEIAEVYHVPVERVRAGRPNEMGKVDTYFISSDWSNVRTHKPYPVAAFNTTDRTSASQLIYTGSYSPNMDVYHTPDYLAANNWALVDQRVAEFHLNNIENGFSGSYFISFANGIPTAEERIQIENSLTEKFVGAKNSGKFVLTFSDDRSRVPEITPISVSDADKQYLALQELLVQNILTGHRVTSPMLMGIKSDTGLGSNADELNSAANFYLNTVVRSFQLHILDTLQMIFSVNQMDLPVDFVQLKPITTRFTNQDLMAVMTQDEIREELGLAPLDEEIVVKDELSSDKFALLENILGDLEDIPEDWELIDEQEVEDEHSEFDFERVLNEIANEKIELANTGTARPNARSSQDGTNKSDNDFYKVRYVYAKDNFLSQEGETRDFCRIMTNAKKIYRKEDITQMTTQEVNKGWGPKGNSATYSIWFWKGGGNCHHYWLRQIYKTSLRGAKSPIKSSELIGYTKARSEGFTAEKNDNKVAIAPKRMPNNGFKN
tara:strand:+ start:4667 stop:6508 length:1842 start_codon:yes stop_codon:yes gene_type:complete